jgi:hypothetical protein
MLVSEYDTLNTRGSNHVNQTDHCTINPDSYLRNNSNGTKHSIQVYVHDNYTDNPLESVLVSVLKWYIN